MRDRLTLALFASHYDDRDKAIARWGYESEATKERYRNMAQACVAFIEQEIERRLKEAAS